MSVKKPLALAVSLAALSAPSLAQQGGTALEEIVVTASKREQNLMEVSSSVQAFQGAALEREGLRDLGDLTQRIPGASIVSKSGAGFETIQLRGISSGTVGDATVGYYIDELAFGIPNLQLAPPSRLIDLERVEVLRGPQGTLYGQGSMGGTIKMITRKPDTEQFDIKLAAEGSQTEDGGNNYALDAAVNIPVVEGKFAIRLSGGYEDLSGFADSLDTGDDEINDVEAENFRIRALWTPNDKLEVSGGYWYVSNDQNFSNFLVNEDPAQIFTGRTDDSWVKTEADLYSLFISWDLGFATLESGSSYTDYTLSFDLGFGVPIAPGLDVALVNRSEFPTDSFNQELRLVSNSDGPTRWIAGIFYTDASIDSEIDLFFTPDLGGVLPPLLADEGTIDTTSWSVYGELSHDFMDGFLTALVGLRYYEDDREAKGNSLIYGPSPSQDETFDSVNPRFNLAINPSDDGMVYINVAKGFRSGTIQTQGQALLPSLVGITTDVVVDSDELWTYELGTKWALVNGSLLLDVAAYYTDWSDIQVPFDALGTGLVSVMNAGDAEITGLDFGLTWLTPIEGLSFEATGNFNDTEFQDTDPALAAALPTVAEGESIPGVPESSYRIAGTYSAPLGYRDLNAYANLAYAYRDDQIDLASGLESDDIENLSARVGVRAGQWEAYLFGDNLTDERGPSVRQITTVQSQYPRRIGLQLRYQLR